MPKPTSFLKKALLILLLSSGFLFPQAEYVRSDNPVYSFLERLDALNIITGYNKFEIPLSRNEVAAFLKQADVNFTKLDLTDKSILNDLKVEFELEFSGSLINSQSLISGVEYSPFSEKQKYLFFHSNQDKANIFINLVAEGNYINFKENYKGTEGHTENNSSLIGIIGGNIRGTFLNKFGFEIRGTNGNVFSGRRAAFLRRDIQYNFKINEKPDETFFDETEGYLTADFDIVKFKLGRDRLNIGYGSVKAILGNSSPLFDYLSMRINYEFLSYSFYHGKILGQTTFIPDSVTLGSNSIEEKYFAYHRISFDISRNFNFGIGEMIVYGGRSIDFSYLNPFTFYKSLEHSNRDRDNAMLFLDIYNKSIDGLFLYSTLLIDDINFGKIGTGWYGNEMLFNAGLYSANFYKLLPIDIRFDYLRIEPYTLSHRLIRNNFTNYGYNLNNDLQPNSHIFDFGIIYRLNYRFFITLNLQYSEHGANIIDSGGNVIKNVGGDINLGHRSFDSETAHFLDGELEYRRNIGFSLTWEPVNEVKFSFNFQVNNYSLQQSPDTNQYNSFLILSLML